MRYLFGCLLFVFLHSCVEKSKNPVITKAIRQEVDSLFRAQQDSLSTLTDSICQTQYDLWFEKAKDSIKSRRLLEIEDIIDE